jgi:hypothetical protein
MEWIMGGFIVFSFMVMIGFLLYSAYGPDDKGKKLF